jgi:hypothetical protein
VWWWRQQQHQQERKVASRQQHTLLQRRAVLASHQPNRCTRAVLAWRLLFSQQRCCNAAASDYLVDLLLNSM